MLIPIEIPEIQLVLATYTTPKLNESMIKNPISPVFTHLEPFYGDSDSKAGLQWSRYKTDVDHNFFAKCQSV